MLANIVFQYFDVQEVSRALSAAEHLYCAFANATLASYHCRSHPEAVTHKFARVDPCLLQKICTFLMNWSFVRFLPSLNWNGKPLLSPRIARKAIMALTGQSGAWVFLKKMSIPFRNGSFFGFDTDLQRVRVSYVIHSHIAICEMSFCIKRRVWRYGHLPCP